uniref:TORTIFOLIA1/TORL1-2 C-terminal domain-containing protein n=1 Tax=Fagus sylvatica TaxID=28930 RepID=A0A2N9I347_FAGSY
MGGGGAIRAVAKVAGIGVVNRGLRGMSSLFQRIASCLGDLDFFHVCTEFRIRVYLSSPESTGSVDPFAANPSLSLVSGPALEPVISDATPTPVPRHVFHEFSLLSRSPEAQNVVASIAPDPNVWNAVMENPVASGLLCTMSSRIDVQSDVQSQPFEESSAESQPGNSDSGFNNIMQNIKVKVLHMGRANRTGNIQHDDFHRSFNSKYRNIERGTAAPYSKQRDLDDLARDKWPEERVNGKDSRMRAFDGDDRTDINQRDSSSNRVGFSKTDGQSEGSFINNKGNWLAIQRQLLQLERQQAHLMNMLQDFMGGSHDSMVTLENRVRGLERVEDMSRDLSISSGRRGGNFAMGFEGSSNRPLGKYNGFSDYSSAKFGRGGDGRIPFGERIAQSDGNALGMRGRGPPWRSDMSDAWDFPTSGASRNGKIGSRRALGGGSMDGRSPKSEHDSDQGGSRRAWDKGAGPVRLGEGPSARSVWQASKDEATLEAIRVAGEDSGTSRTARVAIPEMTAEALGDDNVGHDRDPVWTSWSNAMDALHVGDMDSAYAEVLSTGDDHLLVKLMDRSGPVVDQLSGEVATEVVHAVGQFLLEQNLFDLCLSWIQQLVEVLLENGPNVLSIPMEVKRELLLNLHEASSTMDPPEDWEGEMPDQLLLQLASAWRIDLQQHEK